MKDASASGLETYSESDKDSESNESQESQYSEMLSKCEKHDNIRKQKK